MQHIKIDIAKYAFVSSVSTEGYGKVQKEPSERAGGLDCHRKMSVEQCLCEFCGRRISLVPTMSSKGTGFPTRKSHESRTGCRGCLCETQTPLPQCTEPSSSLVIVHPGGFALRGHCISGDSDHPTHPCAHLWRELAFPSLFGKESLLSLSQGHTVCTALLSLEVPGGASCGSGSWLQCGTERLCDQCCACVCTAAWK